jgi:hypothetical protein
MVCGGVIGALVLLCFKAAPASEVLGVIGAVSLVGAEALAGIVLQLAREREKWGLAEQKARERAAMLRMFSRALGAGVVAGAGIVALVGADVGAVFKTVAIFATLSGAVRLVAAEQLTAATLGQELNQDDAHYKIAACVWADNVEARAFLGTGLIFIAASWVVVASASGLLIVATIVVGLICLGGLLVGGQDEMDPPVRPQVKPGGTARTTP